MKLDFTKKELEFIYDNLDVDDNTDKNLLNSVEKKIRKAIPRYKNYDLNTKKLKTDPYKISQKQMIIPRTKESLSYQEIKLWNWLFSLFICSKQKNFPEFLYPIFSETLKVNNGNFMNINDFKDLTIKVLWSSFKIKI